MRGRRGCSQLNLGVSLASLVCGVQNREGVTIGVGGQPLLHSHLSEDGYYSCLTVALGGESHVLTNTLVMFNTSEPFPRHLRALSRAQPLHPGVEGLDLSLLEAGTTGGLVTEQNRVQATVTWSAHTTSNLPNVKLASDC